MFAKLKTPTRKSSSMSVASHPHWIVETQTKWTQGRETPRPAASRRTRRQRQSLEMTNAPILLQIIVGLLIVAAMFAFVAATLGVAAEQYVQENPQACDVFFPY